MEQVERLEECITRCQGVVKSTTAAVDSFRGSLADSERALQLWESLENASAELMDAVNICDASAHSHRFRDMYLILFGKEVAAEMQLMRQRLLRCLCSVKEKKRIHELMTRRMPHSCNTVEGGAVMSLAYLVKHATTLLSDLRYRELRLVDNVAVMQEALVRACCEDVAMMQICYELQESSSGLSFESHFHAFPFFPEDMQSENNLDAAISRRKADEDSETASLSPLLKSNWTDLHLMRMSLKGAFDAAECKHYFVAAYHFALVMKLLVTKCYTVEELLMTLFVLKGGKKNCEFPQQQETGGKERLEERASPLCYLASSQFHPGAFHAETVTATDTPVPPYWISVMFVSLVWNTAFCYWQKGCVRETYEWLSAIDVKHLYLVVEAKEKKVREVGATNVCGLLTRRYVVEHYGRTSLHGRMTPLGCNSKEGNCENTQNSPVGLQHLLCRVTSLRDVCAIMLVCSTPEDVLFFLFKVHHAIKWQSCCVLHPEEMTDDNENENENENRDEDASNARESRIDAAADMLAIVAPVVEYYLTQSASRIMMSSDSFASSTSTPASASTDPSASSSSSASMTVDGAVRQACDELIRFLSCEKLSGVQDLEERGIPHAWHNSEEPAAVDDADKPLGPAWLTVQVLGVTLAFAHGFCSSPFFQSVFAAQEGKAEEETTMSMKQPTSKWSIWPVSLAGSVQTAARSFIKKLGDLFADDNNDEDSDRQEEYIRSRADIGNGKNLLRESSSTDRRLRASFFISQSFNRNEYMPTERETCSLWFPSLQEKGLALLPEEKVVDGQYKSCDSVALRLLVIACRYNESRSLVSFIPTDDDHDDNTMGKLEHVIPELNYIVRDLMNKLDNLAGDNWLPIWRQERKLSGGRSRTFELLAGLRRATYMSAMGHENVVANGEPSQGKTEHAEDEVPDHHHNHHRCRHGDSNTTCTVMHEGSAVDDNREGEGKESIQTGNNSNGNNDRAGGGNFTDNLLDSQASAYTPRLRFDYSTFTSNSAEGLLAVQQIVEDIMRREEALEQSTSTVEEVTPGDNTRYLSILNSKSRQLLHEELPVIWQFMPWRLIYSSRFHGMSYGAMLSCSQREADASQNKTKIPPMLLVIELAKPLRGTSIHKETEDATLVIGACLSNPLHVGTHRYYGTGDTFVFQLLIPSKSASPTLRAYRATGANNQFINSSVHTLAIGGGGGCSIFLNGTLTHGSTSACATFASPPLTCWRTSSSSSVETRESAALSHDFDIRSIELLVVGERKQLQKNN